MSNFQIFINVLFIHIHKLAVSVNKLIDDNYMIENKLCTCLQSLCNNTFLNLS